MYISANTLPKIFKNSQLTSYKQVTQNLDFFNLKKHGKKYIFIQKK